MRSHFHEIFKILFYFIDDLPDPSDDEAGGSVIGNNAGADPVQVK